MACFNCLTNNGGGGPPTTDNGTCCGFPIDQGPVRRVQVLEDKGCKIISSDKLCMAGETVGYAIFSYDPEACAFETVYIDVNGVAQGSTLPAGWENCPCTECFSVMPTALCIVDTDTQQTVGKYWTQSTQTGTNAFGLYFSNPSVVLTPFVLGPTQELVDCENYIVCELSSDVDLAANCIGGEVANQDVIAATDAEIVDDPTADNLCRNTTGVWIRNGEANTPPFPINETFRNGTTNDPNWTFFNDAHLTSGVEDASGQGWLRINPDQTFRTGTAVIDTAFPSTEDVTFEFTYATYSNQGTPGVFPNGIASGMSVFLLDGSLPVPITYPLGGALSYSSNHQSNEPSVAGGYVGVGLDENGNYSNSHPTQGVGQDAPPGNTARAPGENHVAIRGNTDGVDIHGPGAGTFIVNGSVAANANGNKLGTQFRTNPVRVRGSFINVAGSILASIELDFNDGNGFQPIITRYDVTPVAGLPPATFKLGFGSSTGNVPGAHEIRDLVISRSAKQYWRSLRYEAQDIPACATNFSFSISGNIQILSDTQANNAGNTEVEHRVLIVNSATNTVLQSFEVVSSPSQVNDVIPFNIASGTLPISDINNIRVYVGAETLDNAGSYGSSRWSNFVPKYTALGCPTEKIRTIAISAPCPLPVTVTGGLTVNSGDTIVNVETADNVAIAEICADGLPAFRRERRTTDGQTIIDFLGSNGNQITPVNWFAGTCNNSVFHYQQCLEYTDGPNDPVRFTRVFHKNLDTNAITFQDHNYVTGAPITVPGTATITDCELGSCGQYIGQFCTFDTNSQIFGTAYGIRDCNTHDVVYYNTADNQIINATTNIVQCITADSEFNVFCDDNGLFIRRGVYSDTDGEILGVVDTQLDFVTPYVPVGTISSCGDNRFHWAECLEYVVGNADPVRFTRVYHKNLTNNTITTQDHNYETGALISVPVGATLDQCSEHLCEQPQYIGDICHTGGTAYGLRDCVTGDVVYRDKITNAIIPNGSLIGCDSPNLDTETIVLCDQVGSFLRHIVYSKVTGAVVGNYDTALDATTPYIISGTVRNCSDSMFHYEECLEYTQGANQPVKFTRVYHKNLSTNVITVQDHDYVTGATIVVPTVNTTISFCDFIQACIPLEYVGDVCYELTPGITLAGYALRNCETGQITYHDKVDNTIINTGNLVECPLIYEQPLPIFARYEVLQGAQTWVAPTGNNLLGLTVTVIRVGNVATPITFEDSSGAVSVLYAGQTISYSITKQSQSQIDVNAGGVKVTTSNAGDIVAINWTVQ